MKKAAYIIGFLALVFLSACSFSLAEDITPPPGAEQVNLPGTQSPPSVEMVYPLVPPNPINGQAIYAEKCAPCHGATGQGDGPKARQQLVQRISPASLLLPGGSRS
jgi:hypothetical protein